MTHKYSPYCPVNNGRCPECNKWMTELSEFDLNLLRPDSSVCVEQRLIKSEAPESRTGQGSKDPARELFTMPTEELVKLMGDAAIEGAQRTQNWWQYVIVRKELSGGAAMAQACHAAAYSANLLKCAIPERTRMCVLKASKEDMEKLQSITLLSCEMGMTYYAFKESEGTLAGVITAISFLTSDREKARRFLSDLKTWSK